MKTFEVYSLYDTAYRGRVLIATVQADSFEANDNGVAFYKDGFFKSRQTGLVMINGAFAVLDTEFSLSINAPQQPKQFFDSILNSGQAGGRVAPALPKKRAKKSNSDSFLKLDE